MYKSPQATNKDPHHILYAAINKFKFGLSVKVNHNAKNVMRSLMVSGKHHKISFTHSSPIHATYAHTHTHTDTHISEPLLGLKVMSIESLGRVPTN